MSVSVRMVRASARTTTGLQSFTVPGFGTPKAAIFIVTEAWILNSVNDGAAIAFGFATDATHQFCITSSSQDATGDSQSNCNSRKSNTKCISLLTSTGSMNAEANWDAWVTDGIQVNWTDAPTLGVIVTVILFGGDDLSVYAGDFLASSALSTDTVVTAPNFPPDQLIVLGGVATAYDTPAVRASMQIGFADRTSPVSQCSSAWFADDNTNNSQGHNYVSTAFVSVSANVGAVTPTLGQLAIAITAFSATGFTARTQIAGGAVRYPYLALSYTSVNGAAPHWNGVIDSPIAAAPVSVTVNAPGFKPQFVLQLPTGVDIVNAERNSGTPNAPGAGSYGLAAFTATEIGSHSVGDDDAAAAMDTESFASSEFRCRSDVKTNLHVATFTNFVSLGWVLDYSITNTARARKWASMAIGEWPVPPVQAPVPVFDNTYRQRRM